MEGATRNVVCQVLDNAAAWRQTWTGSKLLRGPFGHHTCRDSGLVRLDVDPAARTIKPRGKGG
eukprot:10337132-Alexandrium_andersonii.AAC.1